jgi:tetratricopeptide (TPR) repeat protein
VIFVSAPRKESRSATVGLRKLIILLAVAGSNPVIAQDCTPVSRSDVDRKSSQALPKSCLTQEHPSEQVSVLLETIRDHPTAGAYNTLGALYARDSRVTCAISAFETALRLDDQNWQSHYNLGLALLTKGDRARAASELQNAVQQKPDSAASHFALGTLLQEGQKLARAVEEFQAVLQIDPNFAPACLSSGVLYTQQGKDCGGCESISTGDPEQPEIYPGACKSGPDNSKARRVCRSGTRIPVGNTVGPAANGGLHRARDARSQERPQRRGGRELSKSRRAPAKFRGRSFEPGHCPGGPIRSDSWT